MARRALSRSAVQPTDWNTASLGTDRQPTITVQSDVQHHAQESMLTRESTRRCAAAQRLPVIRIEIARRRGEREGAGFDQCADALCGGRAGVPDGSAAELQPRHDGGAHGRSIDRVVIGCCCFACRSASWHARTMPFRINAQLGDSRDQIEQDIIWVIAASTR